MDFDWFYLVLFGAGWFAGRYYSYFRIGTLFKKAQSGEPIAFGGKAYVLSEIPHRPDFPGFAKQSGGGSK